MAGQGDARPPRIADPELRGAGRKVVDVQGEPGLIGELLQFGLPQSDTRAIGAATVGRDRPRGRPMRANQVHRCA